MSCQFPFHPLSCPLILRVDRQCVPCQQRYAPSNFQGSQKLLEAHFCKQGTVTFSASRETPWRTLLGYQHILLSQLQQYGIQSQMNHHVFCLQICSIYHIIAKLVEISARRAVSAIFTSLNMLTEQFCIHSVSKLSDMHCDFLGHGINLKKVNLQDF